ncbi:hypothetical protein Tco_0087270 [Tanacetum coccineum]
MDASDLAHGEVISLRTTVHAQMSEITELQSADRRRQRAISDLLETDRRRRVMGVQPTMYIGLALQIGAEVRVRIPIRRDISVPCGLFQGTARGGCFQPGLPEDTGSSS